ncbi:taste receptor type 2 member 7-like [Chrysemys picta bellii]|uniref:taste receptor type 2 member 7-like n=1 Tax=Chrysemys picta bellii TaxID=8478 RepID=UPI000388BD40|nr:taste receptor type 2 member 7-like [Chrysemys picta bellii]
MKKSLDPAAIFYLIISAIELSVGVVANGYIVALNCIDWAKSRTLSSYDKIITSLAFSRFCLQFLVTLNNISSKLPFCVLLCEDCHFQPVPLQLFKIENLQTGAMAALGLCALLLGYHSCFTLFSYSYCVSSHNSTDRLSTNSTMSDNINNLLEFTFLIHSVGSIFPLILFIASSVLLIISLWRHIRKMNLNSDLNQNFRNPNTDAHMRALKSVVSFFIIYNIYYVASTFPIGNPSYFNDEWKYTVCIFIAAAYPSVHSIILILGNPKLKLASANILNSANSCFRKVTS